MATPLTHGRGAVELKSSFATLASLPIGCTYHIVAFKFRQLDASARGTEPAASGAVALGKRENTAHVSAFLPALELWWSSVHCTHGSTAILLQLVPRSPLLLGTHCAQAPQVLAVLC